jgi:hypothetical protein
VSLIDTPPLTSDDFYLIDSIEYEPTGFMYRLYGVDQLFHGSELYPLLPIVVSDDVLKIDDKFYHNGNIYDCCQIFLDDNDKWLIGNENNESFLESDVIKVIATPEMFGWIYNEGPPHDHNYNWIDSRYLEVYHEQSLVPLVKNNFKIYLAVKEGDNDYVLDMHENKIIIDKNLLIKDLVR